jgi:chromosome segregation ATPase
MTDEQMKEIKQQFERIDRRFDGIDQRFDGIDGRLDGIDHRFDGVDQRLDRVEGTLQRVDAEVHRNGILLEDGKHELKLASESFQTLQSVTNAEIELVRESIDHRVSAT